MIQKQLVNNGHIKSWAIYVYEERTSPTSNYISEWSDFSYLHEVVSYRLSYNNFIFSYHKGLLCDRW